MRSPRQCLALTLPLALLQDSWNVFRDILRTLASPPVFVWIAGVLGLAFCAMPLVFWLLCLHSPILPFAGFLGAIAAWTLGTNASKQAALMSEYGEALRVWTHESALMRLYYSHFPRNQAEAAAVQTEPELQPIPTYNWRNVPTHTHSLIIGETNTGKSLLAMWLSTGFDNADIKVYDPDAAPHEWPGLEVVGCKGDFAAISEAMTYDLEDLQGRYELRGSGIPVGIEQIRICEEFPAIADEVEIAPTWLKKLGRRGRKAKQKLIIISQEDEVAAMGIEGEGGIRKAFTYIRLGKQALDYATKLKNQQLIAFLEAQERPCMVEKMPAILPDLSGFAAMLDARARGVARFSESYPSAFPLRKSESSEPPGESLESPEEAAETWERFSGETSKTASENPSERRERLEKLRQLRAIGYGKGKCIEELWDVKPGGSPRYKMAEEMYEQMLKELEEK